MGYWTSGYDIIFLIAYYSLLNKYDTVKKQNKCCVNNSIYNHTVRTTGFIIIINFYIRSKIQITFS